MCTRAQLYAQVISLFAWVLWDRRGRGWEVEGEDLHYYNTGPKLAAGDTNQTQFQPPGPAADYWIFPSSQRGRTRRTRPADVLGTPLLPHWTHTHPRNIPNSSRRVTFSYFIWKCAFNSFLSKCNWHVPHWSLIDLSPHKIFLVLFYLRYRYRERRVKRQVLTEIPDSQICYYYYSETFQKWRILETGEVSLDHYLRNFITWNRWWYFYFTSKIDCKGSLKYRSMYMFNFIVNLLPA